MNPDVRWKQRFENFDRAYLLLRDALAHGPAALNPLEKSGVAKLFELTFELAWKTLKDYMEEQGASLPSVFPKSILKEAFASGLLPDGELWIAMLEKRNQLSHQYNQIAFDQAVAAIHADYLPALGDLHRFFREKTGE